MTVFAAIFPHARRVTLDVADVGGGFVKRWRQEQDQIVSSTDEMFFERSQRDFHSLGIADAGDRGPGLRNRIDPRFDAFPRAERGAIVKICTAIPRSVPRLSVDRLCQLCGADAACFRFLAVPTEAEQLRKIIEHTNLKPGKPDTLAFACLLYTS